MVKGKIPQQPHTFSPVLYSFPVECSILTHLSMSSQISNDPSPPSVELECGGEAGEAVKDDVDPE